jgi:lipopolysaccharide/colanic/teichoic acid biosynthesis glycosyltransferase
MYLWRGKRVLDVGVALAGHAIAAVPMALIAAAIRLTMGAPVLHRVTRPGLQANPFVLNKFRTMRPPEVPPASCYPTAIGSPISDGSCGGRASTNCRNS